MTSMWHLFCVTLQVTSRMVTPGLVRLKRKYPSQWKVTRTSVQCNRNLLRKSLSTKESVLCLSKSSSICQCFFFFKLSWQALNSNSALINYSKHAVYFQPIWSSAKQKLLLIRLTLAFSRFARLTSFPALKTGFPRLAPVALFPALVTTVTHFPALVTTVTPFSGFREGDTFFLARHRLVVFMSSQNPGAALLLRGKVFWCKTWMLCD